MNFAKHTHPGDVKVTPEVVFIDTGNSKKGINVADTTGSVKVKVNEPYRVILDGKIHIGGDVLTVPADDERDTWIKAGWVTPVPTPSKDKAA